MRSLAHGCVVLLFISMAVMGQSFPTLTEFPLLQDPRTEIAALDDVDGDGVRDVVILNCVPVPPPTGIYSGATGALITLLAAPLVPTACIDVIGCGDWDGDGLGDVAIQTALPAELQVYSSVTGLQIAAFTIRPSGERRLGVLDDLDGDGIPEILVPTPVGPFGVSILSSSTGAEMRQFPLFPISHAVVVEDFDQDGLDDILIAETVPGPPPFHRGIIRSSASGAPLQTLNLPQYGQYVYQAQRLGDLNGDLLDEMAIVQLDGSEGRIVIFDGTGPMLETINIEQTTASGGSYAGDFVSGVGDVNGDGRDDFVVVDFAGITDPTRIKLTVYSGADLCPMTSLERDVVPLNGHRRLREIGDINGDGLDDLLVALSSNVTIEAMGGRGLYGAGSTLTADWISGALPQRLDGQFELRGGTPNGTAVVLVSSESADVPLGAFDLSIDLTPGNFLAANIPMDGFGELNLPLSLDLPIIAGIPVYLQAFELAATGLEASNGLGLLFSSSGNQSPQVASVSPTWLPSGATLDPATLITGDCFTAGVQASLNGMPLTVTPTADVDVINVSANPAPVVPPDSLLTVTNPGGGTATFIYNPSPEIDSLEVPESPTDELATIGGDLVTLRGRHFFPGSILTVDGVTVIPSTLEETLIVFESLPLAAGTASVVVSSPNGGVATFSAVVVQRSPVILTVEPLSAVAGDVVAIRGDFFAAGLSVTIGGQSLVPTVDNTPGLPPGVTVTVPTGLGCDEALVVANPDGSNDSASFNPTPVVTSYTSTVMAGLPALIFVEGPIETLVGTSVTIDGVAAGTVLSTPSGITFVATARPAGTVNIVIASVAGCSVTLPLTYM